ncbi:hypothetical protein [Streptosporangium sp. NBC_01756]|uniref:hypothetical protein n=1 Tax=Streptosporangium sp. NBC_01756 TaxID=2975950 RepID=UPI002DDB18E0|nr:hypothetical protein [Streptosporangium sp. NBC_01756]WSC83347.1 hypothetical protein OIE48_23350 [Streptosporangium sp. NBC_01756]
MVGGASREPSPKGKRAFPEVDPTLRATAAATAGGTLVILWPAFTLGAYGAIFFDSVLGIWAVATAVLLSGLMLHTRGALPWAGWVALALPSVWIVLAVMARRTHGAHYLHYFEVVLTLVGAPTLTWLLSRILLPDYAELPELHRLRAVLVTIAVGILAFLLGKFNYLFLTCADFDISGNNTPPGCAPGPPLHLL